MPASKKPASAPSWIARASVLSLLSVLSVTPAFATAAFADEGPRKPEAPRPPAAMSDVGGARLARPGTQVRPKAGAPALPKKVSARSWLVADAESGQILAAHNPHWRLAPASTLKMLFADTLLPKFPKDQVHRVSLNDLAGIGAGSSLVGIKEDLPYSVHDLWLGVFLRSGNDAVHVLSSMNHGVDATVKDMQEHAHDLQAEDTHVVTPDGYDAKGQVSSAYDLTLFARSGLQKKDFREYCSTAYADFPGLYAKKGKKDEDRDQDAGAGATTGQAGSGQSGAKSAEDTRKREHFGIQNTNRLLTGAPGLDKYPGIAGVKNGNTTNAGATYTGLAQRGGRQLLVTVMHPEPDEPQAVYKEAGRLLDWGFAADGKVTPVGELVAPRSVLAEQAKARAKREGAHGGSRAGGAGQASASGPAEESGGLGTALAITGGTLVVLGGVVYVVRRRRPLPGGGGGQG
ncbi:D-alanyl-D-alanine carboxypeptidase family protein [Streptomyces sp. NPDC007088]|uniref:D-alanyl-D-alanine carboxypeptidase family protein n=1 Tax=Streptomyces sp. NPDC007088 TaxID=3364773 RepID=UPI003681DB1D